MAKLSDAIRKMKNTTCSAVIVAAGSSTRMGEDKLRMRLAGMPVLAHTLRTFQCCDCVKEIVVVTREDKLEETAKLCRDYGILKAVKVVKGGKTRTESALAGVLAADRNAKLTLIHDGARPLITPEQIYNCVHAAALYGYATLAVPVTDTVKLTDGETVRTTLNRNELAAVQTPQVFRTDVIKTALTKAIATGTEYTDDCAAVEAVGVTVHLVEGSKDNLKITTPQDIQLAELILKQREVRR